MPRIIQPVVSRKGRVIVLSGATLWLIAAMVLSATPGGAAIAPPGAPGAAAVTAGGVATVIETLDGTDGLLYAPTIVSARGRIFVADAGANRVVKVNRVGELLTAETIFGRQGAGPGEFQRPNDVAVDSAGNVFAIDRRLQRINKYRADGTFVKSIATPAATNLVIDSRDELIVYPVSGPALLQRYSNDLEPGAELFEDTDELTHSSPIGVLMAVDDNDRLFLLDQADLTLTIYDRDMQQVASWQVDAPELRESIALSTQRKQAKFPEVEFRILAIKAMAVDSASEEIALAYNVRRDLDGDEFSRIAWFSTDGRLLDAQDRDDLISSVAFLPDGSRVEATKESLYVYDRGSRTARGARGN
jgi:hypothetical protein